MNVGNRTAFPDAMVSDRHPGGTGSPPIVWGILIAPAHDRSTPAAARDLARITSGVSVVGDTAGATSARQTNPPFPAAETLAEAVAALPPAVELVVLADLDCVQELTPALIADLVQELGADDAGITRGTPVTDALKQVRNGLLTRSVPREGLVWSALPQVVRRGALSEAAAERQATETDVTARLLARGHSVRVRVVQAVAEGSGAPRREV